MVVTGPPIGSLKEMIFDEYSRDQTHRSLHLSLQCLQDQRALPQPRNRVQDQILGTHRSGNRQRDPVEDVVLADEEFIDPGPSADHRGQFLDDDRPAADVAIEAVIEEESTGNGALACLQRGYRADAALIPEPMGNAVMRSQVGVMWFHCVVRGHPVHVAYAGRGANAIEAAYRLIGELHTLEDAWNKRGHEAYAKNDHPLNFNVGKIEGGDWASSVPAWCRFDMRVGVFPGQDLATARKEVETCLAEAARKDPFLANNPPEVVWDGFQAEGFIQQPGTEVEATLAASHKAIFGAEMEERALTGTTDARFFGLYAKMPALVYGPIAENIHGFDERVDLQSCKDVTKAIALFIADWCGLRPA